MRLQDSDKRGLDILSDWVYENGTPSKELQDFMERLVYLLKVATITEKHVKRHLLRMDENDLLTIEVEKLKYVEGLKEDIWALIVNTKT